MFVSAMLTEFRFRCLRAGRTLRDLARRYRIEAVLAVILIAAAAYLISFGVRLSTGVSGTMPVPKYTARLQIVNGTDDPGALALVAERLNGYGDPDLEIEVVARENFDLRKIGQSIVVSRQEDLTVAGLLARRLGLPPGQVRYRPLENNRDHVSVTLVLGTDYGRLTLAGLSEEEIVD